jgi:hypothetical protein
MLWNTSIFGFDRSQIVLTLTINSWKYSIYWNTNDGSIRNQSHRTRCRKSLRLDFDPAGAYREQKDYDIWIKNNLSRAPRNMQFKRPDSNIYLINIGKSKVVAFLEDFDSYYVSKDTILYVVCFGSYHHLWGTIFIKTTKLAKQPYVCDPTLNWVLILSLSQANCDGTDEIENVAKRSKT